MEYNDRIKGMIDLLRRDEGVVKVIEHGRTRLETQSTRAKPTLSLLRRRAAYNAAQAAVPLLAVPALAARRLRDGDASLTRHVDNAKRRTSFIAHLSHASRQPHGTASNVTGLPHLQVVISACSALTTAVAITCGTGGQNRVVAALPPVLCLSYASPRSMGSQTELRQSTICMQ